MRQHLRDALTAILVLWLGFVSWRLYQAERCQAVTIEILEIVAMKLLQIAPPGRSM